MQQVNVTTPVRSGKFLLSFDIEEYFQVENLRSVFPREGWSSLRYRVRVGVEKILEILDERNILSTFFILGWLAERCPEIVRSISSRCHEIACHGYGHTVLNQMSETDMREDIKRAKGAIESAAGRVVHGYRAPNFSIVPGLYQVLRELGFEYDSSIFPFRLHNRYGRVDDVKFTRSVDGILLEKNTGILELPVSVLKLGMTQIPWAGGAYFRIIPSFLYMIGVKKILDENPYFLFYIHSWEFDPDQPRVRFGVKWDHRFRHYAGLHQVETNFKKMIEGASGDLTINSYINQMHRSREAFV